MTACKSVAPLRATQDHAKHFGNIGKASLSVVPIDLFFYACYSRKILILSCISLGSSEQRDRKRSKNND